MTTATPTLPRMTDMHAMWTDFCRGVEDLGSTAFTPAQLCTLAVCPVFEFSCAAETAALDWQEQQKDPSFVLPYDQFAVLSETLGVTVIMDVDRNRGTWLKAGVQTEYALALTMLTYLPKPPGATGVDLRVRSTIMLSRTYITPAGERETVVSPANVWAYGSKEAHGKAPQPTALDTLINDGSSDPDEVKAYIGRYCEYALANALIFIGYATQPAHYLVAAETNELRQPKMRPGKGGTLVDEDGSRVKKLVLPRLNERQKIIYLAPERVHVIRPKIESAADRTDTAERSPHLRRGHVRTFKAERYRAAKGRTVYVRPHWVGEREWQFQRIHYRVISG